MHSVHMAEPRCEYCSMISLFTFDASKVSCVVFSQKHKSFLHHCDHVLLVLLWIYIFHFLHQTFGHRYARQICTSTSTTISNRVTGHSRTVNSSLTFWMPKCLHHFFDLHVYVMNLFSADMAQCWYAYVTTVKMRAREDQNPSSEFLLDFSSTRKAVNYIT